MKRLVNLNDLMQEQLRTMYDSEMQLKDSLPEIFKKSTDNKLRGIIEAYQNEQEDQIWRLKQVFDQLFTQKRGEKSQGMKALLNEADELVSRSMDKEVMDAGVITALQHIIHYQIAGYGAICNYANTLGLYEVAAKMHINLEEEKRADRKLAIVAEEAVNLKATEANRQ